MPNENKTSKKGESVNENGTPVSVHECQACGNKFTLCPLVPDDKAHEWPNCMAPNCESYDPHRDAAILFQSDSEIANNGKPASLKMLQARKQFKKTGELK